MKRAIDAVDVLTRSTSGFTKIDSVDVSKYTQATSREPVKKIFMYQQKQLQASP